MIPLEAFDALYRAHVRGLLAFCVRRTGRPAVAADLCAETFAAALAGRERFDPRRGSESQWLYGIARHQLQRALERGHADDRLRRRLGIETPRPDDETLAAIERLGAPGVEETIGVLAPAYRDAVRARVLEEQDYEEIAAGSGTSPAAVRQRVSRGLAALREHFGGREAT